MVEREHPELSIRRQCELLGVARAGIYYQAQPERPENLRLMNFLDELHTECPFYGYRKLTWEAQKSGYAVNHKRVQRLLEQMSIEAVYPRRKPNLSTPGHTVYPYLLRNVQAQYPNHIWGVDITYIRMRVGLSPLSSRPCGAYTNLTIEIHACVSRSSIHAKVQA